MITIVAKRETHSKADALQVFESRTWEKILAQIDHHIERTLEQLVLASEPIEIYRLQGRIEGLKTLRKVPDSVLATFPKG